MGQDFDRRILYESKGETELMIQTIIEKLRQNPDVSGWTVTEKINSSLEVFLIKEKLDMNRAADTHEFDVCVYVDFQEGDERYKGHAHSIIGISDSAEEIGAKIDSAVFSAGFVKNKWYDLPTNDDGSLPDMQRFSNIEDLKGCYDRIHGIIYGDYGMRSEVNSCEIFAIEGERRVVTSKGTDVRYPYSEFTFELVTDCNTGSEPVEIFNGFYLTHIDLLQIEEIVKKQLTETEGRSLAVRNPKMEHQRIILSGDAVEDFLFFYLGQADDRSIYQGTSFAKQGELFQAEDAVQKLQIRTNPSLSCSVEARPVDSEGKILRETVLYEGGRVVNIRTSARYSHYLGIANEGTCSTFEADGGEQPLEEYRKGDYIEIIAFSSFLVDPGTGDFGGEFRLAKQVKNGEVSYITGGSISENILKVQNRMVFSKELEDRKYSRAPKAIIIDDITVAGE